MPSVTLDQLNSKCDFYPKIMKIPNIIITHYPVCEKNLNFQTSTGSMTQRSPPLIRSNPSRPLKRSKSPDECLNPIKPKKKPTIPPQNLLKYYEPILDKRVLSLRGQVQQLHLKTPSGLFQTKDKFWHFQIKGKTTTYIRYGKILEDGSFKERAEQVQLHQYPNDARQFVERLIDEKLKAGYVEKALW
ncbi:hypothetical protein G9A89_010233 [Geosiphon pyriformis]|nr:hypothetical protein G9A89_010233 [Geosiphon pyriformis]